MAYYAVSDNMRFFDRFTLITPDGTRYEFGGDGATEYCVPYYNQVYGDIVSTCWRLTKITTVDNRIIDFKYVADSYMCDIHYAPQLLLIMMTMLVLGKSIILAEVDILVSLSCRHVWRR